MREIMNKILAYFWNYKVKKLANFCSVYPHAKCKTRIEQLLMHMSRINRHFWKMNMIFWVRTLLFSGWLCYSLAYHISTVPCRKNRRSRKFAQVITCCWCIGGMQLETAIEFPRVSKRMYNMHALQAACSAWRNDYKDDVTPRRTALGRKVTGRVSWTCCVSFARQPNEERWHRCRYLWDFGGTCPLNFPRLFFQNLYNDTVIYRLQHESGIFTLLSSPVLNAS